jgi:hypothetical protein
MFAKSPFRDCSDHLVRLRCQVFVARLEHTLLSWRRCLRSMGDGEWNYDTFAISSRSRRQEV